MAPASRGAGALAFTRAGFSTVRQEMLPELTFPPFFHRVFGRFAPIAHGTGFALREA